MTELQKKILEQSAIAALLAVLVWYQTGQLKEQKQELGSQIQAVYSRLNACENDRYNLSEQVAKMEATLEYLTSDSKSGKKRK
jgi:hypothetical protein